MNVYWELTSETRLLISEVFDSNPISIIFYPGRARLRNVRAPLAPQIFAYGDIKLMSVRNNK